MVGGLGVVGVMAVEVDERVDLFQREQLHLCLHDVLLFLQLQSIAVCLSSLMHRLTRKISEEVGFCPF